MATVSELANEIEDVKEELEDLYKLKESLARRITYLHQRQGLLHSQLFQEKQRSRIVESESSEMTNEMWRLLSLRRDRSNLGERLVPVNCSCREFSGDMEDCPVHGGAEAPFKDESDPGIKKTPHTLMHYGPKTP